MGLCLLGLMGLCLLALATHGSVSSRAWDLWVCVFWDWGLMGLCDLGLMGLCLLGLGTHGSVSSGTGSS